MRLAGYSGTDTYLRNKAEQFLKDPIVVEAIQQRDTYVQSRTRMIADRQERQSFWTQLMRNEDPDAKPEYDVNGIPKPTDNVPLSQRIKASELLGKSEADFIDRVHVEGQITITDIIKESYRLPESENDSIEAIEAQYKMIQNYEQLEENKNEESQEDEEDKALEGRSPEDIQETLVEEIQESNRLQGLNDFI